MGGGGLQSKADGGDVAASELKSRLTAVASITDGLASENEEVRKVRFFFRTADPAQMWLCVDGSCQVDLWRPVFRHDQLRFLME